MSEYASEEIIVPTHVDWFQPLKDLVEKITAQDGERIGFESLCHEQAKAIDSLLALVESMDKRIEYCKENNQGWIESRVLMALFKSHKKAAQSALDEFGMKLPLLHTDAIKVR